MIENIIISLLSWLLPIKNTLKPEIIGTNISISQPLEIYKPKDDLKISAENAILVNLDTGKTIYEKNSQKPANIASIAKLITVLVIIQNEDISKYYIVPRDIKDITGSDSLLRVGDEITIRNLIAMSLIASSNQAAYTLAYNYSDGDIDKFAQEMNKLASSLGMKNSHFKNPVGYDEKDHYSTASDLKKLAMYALRQSTLSVITNQTEKVIKTKSGREIEIDTTNRLLGKEIPGFEAVTGLKTGTTPKAGECLIVSAKTDDEKTFVAIILGSSDRYGDAKKLFEYAKESTK